LAATTVYLGNHQPITQTRNQRTPIGEKRCTTVTPPDGMSLVAALTDITHPSLWSAHSDAPTPAWVASTNPALAALLAEHWGCELRDVEEEPGC